MNVCRVLVVDDEAGMLRSVERVLGQEYQLASTRSPREAIDLSRTFQPDLAILDIQMPEMDGFQLMEELQAIDPELDVILMTGSVHEIDAKLVKAIRKEAFYFLQKPFDRGVLLSLVERCLKLKRLDRSNRDHQLRMEKELSAARAFQQNLLPPGCGQVGGVSVSAHYLPCNELAGDFYDYAAVPPDGAAIVVADVSGHGAGAAMLTGSVKSAFHSASADQYEPACVVERVANAIRAFGHHHFITLICARVRNDALEFVNAGHPPGILLNGTKGPALLESTGPIISPALHSSWEQAMLPVTRGCDRMILFTDAVVEAEAESGQYGVDRLLEEIKNNPGDCHTMAEQILKSVRQFVAGRVINDDLTLLVADL
ncbi:MAG: SpoIIE family protein phosphatase [Acidobacteriaceae bacterium]|nr:SpoIIE family protein phosphatase [Acidobacteriaceae bacterium]